MPPPPPTAIGRLVQRMRVGRGVRIQGVDGLMVRYAQCCQPVPGDKVTGYVTRGRGIGIHRVDCPNLLALGDDPERRMDLDWQEAEGEVFMVRLGVVGEDRRGLYADICAAIAHAGTNIRNIELNSGEGGTTGHVIVEVESLSHLNKVIKAVRRVKGVADVGRELYGAVAAKAVVRHEEHVVGATPRLSWKPAIEVVWDGRRAADANI